MHHILKTRLIKINIFMMVALTQQYQVMYESVGGFPSCCNDTSMRDLTSSEIASGGDASSSGDSSCSGSSSAPSIESCNSKNDDTDFDESGCDKDSDSESLLRERVFEGSTLSVDEGVFCIMNLFLKKELQKSLVGEILKVVLQFLPGEHNMPKTQYLLFK